VEGEELVASILLRIAFPPLYPTPGTPLTLTIHDVMITDALAPEMGRDKVLRSIAGLEEPAILRAMLTEAEAIQPDPCVFELTTWLSDNWATYMHILGARNDPSVSDG
jgi:hypothetical protein